MTEPIKFLTDDEINELQEIVNYFRDKKNNSTGRGFFSDEFHQAPEVYIGKVKVGGLTALQTSPNFVPGKGTCEIYQIIQNGNNYTLQIVEGLEKEVYNLSTNIISAGSYIPIARDKFGKWLSLKNCTETVGTGTGTGTGTASGYDQFIVCFDVPYTLLQDIVNSGIGTGNAANYGLLELYGIPAGKVLYNANIQSWVIYEHYAGKGQRDSTVDRYQTPLVVMGLTHLGTDILPGESECNNGYIDYPEPDLPNTAYDFSISGIIPGDGVSSTEPGGIVGVTFKVAAWNAIDQYREGLFDFNDLYCGFSTICLNITLLDYIGTGTGTGIPHVPNMECLTLDNITDLGTLDTADSSGNFLSENGADWNYSWSGLTSNSGSFSFASSNFAYPGTTSSLEHATYLHLQLDNADLSSIPDCAFIKKITLKTTIQVTLNSSAPLGEGAFNLGVLSPIGFRVNNDLIEDIASSSTMPDIFSNVGDTIVSSTGPYTTTEQSYTVYSHANDSGKALTGKDLKAGLIDLYPLFSYYMSDIDENDSMSVAITNIKITIEYCTGNVYNP